MGTLLYGSPPSEIPLEDRLLAHLKMVIVSKLRRNEAFLLSWEIDASEGSGRMSLWMHPSIPLQFKFVGSRRPELNVDWINEMARSSMSNEGLTITGEPVPTPGPPKVSVVDNR